MKKRKKIKKLNETKGYVKMRKKTIYEVLKEKLKREPTHNELCEEVKRILREAREEYENKSKNHRKR